MKILHYEPNYKTQLITLIAKNRIDLAELKKREKKFDLDAAREELNYYLNKNYPIFIAVNENQELIGFTICRVDDDVVWDELLFVIPEERRKGVGSALFKKAEEYAIELGGHTLYNWVLPNNYRSIPFLKKHGYKVLNLIEIRKRLPNEKLTQKFKIGKYEYDY
ncbi:MAG: GNAT family N-acetyltransferase [Promethearchaeota archaeon]